MRLWLLILCSVSLTMGAELVVSNAAHLALHVTYVTTDTGIGVDVWVPPQAVIKLPLLKHGANGTMSLSAAVYDPWTGEDGQEVPVYSDPNFEPIEGANLILSERPIGPSGYISPALVSNYLQADDESTNLQNVVFLSGLGFAGMCLLTRAGLRWFRRAGSEGEA